MTSQVLLLLKSTFPISGPFGLLVSVKGVCFHSGLLLPRHCNTSHNITCLGLFPSSCMLVTVQRWPPPSDNEKRGPGELGDRWGSPRGLFLAQSGLESTSASPRRELCSHSLCNGLGEERKVSQTLSPQEPGREAGSSD